MSTEAERVSKGKGNGKGKGKGKGTAKGNVGINKGKKPVSFADDVDVDVEALADEMQLLLRLDVSEDVGVLPASGDGADRSAYHRTMTRVMKSSPSAMNRDLPVLGSTSQGYFSLLRDFRSGYPTSTDVSCWWCCHQFKNPPVGLPRKILGEAFEAIGCFCSFPCAAAYAKDKPYNYRSSLGLLNMLYRRSRTDTEGSKTDGENSGLERVTPAPPRETLKMFGGLLTIDEFRQAARSGKQWRLIHAPLMPWQMYAEEMMSKHGNPSFTRNGLQRSLNIRKAADTTVTTTGNRARRPLALQPATAEPESRAGPSQLKIPQTRTSISQLISFC